MSKRRAVILSVTIEGRSQAETARLYDVSESFVSRILARYRSEGDAAFEPRSRKPNNSPTRVTSETVELITNLRRQLVSQGLDAGPETIAWHLATHHHQRVSVSTIRRRLLAGLQTLLDHFIDHYNQRRPHRSLGRRTPSAAYGLLHSLPQANIVIPQAYV